MIVAVDPFLYEDQLLEEMDGWLSQNDRKLEAWDCDPFARPLVDTVDADLDEEDDTGDWQVLALDRFGDRMVNANW